MGKITGFMEFARVQEGQYCVQVRSGVKLLENGTAVFIDSSLLPAPGARRKFPAPEFLKGGVDLKPVVEVALMTELGRNVTVSGPVRRAIA